MLRRPVASVSIDCVVAGGFDVLQRGMGFGMYYEVMNGWRIALFWCHLC